jgi:hypothetical protein
MTSPMRASRRGAIAATVAVTTAVLFASGTPAAIAAEPAPPDIEAAAPDIRLAEAEQLVTELRTRIDALSAENTELADANTTLLGANDALTVERDQLRQEVDTLTRDRDRLAEGLTLFDDLYDPMEADRKLLLEVRKPIEDMDRREAEQHVARIRGLAQQSNPSELGQLSDRLGEAAPAFLDWRETQFASTDEATRAFIDSGAGAFTSSLDEFTNRFLHNVASRIDGLLTVLDRVR